MQLFPHLFDTASDHWLAWPWGWAGPLALPTQLPPSTQVAPPYNVTYGSDSYRPNSWDSHHSAVSTDSVDYTSNSGDRGTKDCVDYSSNSGDRGTKDCVDYSSNSGDRGTKDCVDYSSNSGDRGTKDCVDYTKNSDDSGTKDSVDYTKNSDDYGNNDKVKNSKINNDSGSNNRTLTHSKNSADYSNKDNVENISGDSDSKNDSKNYKMNGDRYSMYGTEQTHNWNRNTEQSLVKDLNGGVVGQTMTSGQHYTQDFRGPYGTCDPAAYNPIKHDSVGCQMTYYDPLVNNPMMGYDTDYGYQNPSVMNGYTACQQPLIPDHGHHQHNCASYPQLNTISGGTAPPAVGPHYNTMPGWSMIPDNTGGPPSMAMCNAQAPPAYPSTGKRKRRILFSRNQISMLETVFNQNQYLTASQRAALSSQTGLSESQVKIWFQNHRYIKKVQKRKQDAPVETSTCTGPADQVDGASGLTSGAVCDGERITSPHLLPAYGTNTRTTSGDLLHRNEHKILSNESDSSATNCTSSENSISSYLTNVFNFLYGPNSSATICTDSLNSINSGLTNILNFYKASSSSAIICDGSENSVSSNLTDMFTSSNIYVTNDSHSSSSPLLCSEVDTNRNTHSRYGF